MVTKLAMKTPSHERYSKIVFSLVIGNVLNHMAGHIRVGAFVNV